MWAPIPKASEEVRRIDFDKLREDLLRIAKSGKMTSSDQGRFLFRIRALKPTRVELDDLIRVAIIGSTYFAVAPDWVTRDPFLEFAERLRMEQKRIIAVPAPT